MSRLLSVPTVATAVGLAAAAAAPAATAQAATLTVNAPCYVVSPRVRPMITLTGAGFAPSSQLTITDSQGGIDAEPMSDATGAFSIPVAAPLPYLSKPGAIADTITAENDDASGNEYTATATAMLTRFDFGEKGTHRAPGLKAFGEKTTWMFSGLPAGQTIYGHYTYDGKVTATQAFGAAQGPCGTLTVRRRLYPATPHHKTYTIQVDASRHYSRHTTPSGRLRLSLSFF